MLFDKNIEPRCGYCQWGTPLDEGQMMCVKKGICAVPTRVPPRRAAQAEYWKIRHTA